MIQERSDQKGGISVVPPGLSTVLDRFPDRRDTITQLGNENKTFQTLCNDYRRCKVALRHWVESGEEGADGRSEEYEVLQRELEGEILRYLGEFEKRRSLSDRD